ncbi:MAG: T9SS type A sorting domain-containing protein [Taibaiella sp.]|nr:T9SS type A sorting domain-containing protein [Taibaiella sp.]
MMDNLASFVLPSFDGDQIPAHVIATEIPDLEEGFNFFGYFPILAVMSDELEGITGIQGTVAFPLGYDAYSYNPATVEQSGLNTNQWYARIDTSISSYECEEEGFDHSQSVQVRWDIVPLILDMEDGGLYIASEIESPAALSFSFNKSNVGKDVKEGFWVSNLDHLYLYNDEGYCDQYEIGELISDTSANFITVTKEDQAHFNYFILGGKEAPSGVNDVKMTYGIQLYPNPASDVIQLKFENSHPEMNLTITDILGRVVYQEHIRANQLNQLHQIPVRDLLYGNYLIQCSGTGVSYNEKFVKR